MQRYKKKRLILICILFSIVKLTFAEKLNNLIEFFSFSCSHCVSAEQTLQQVLAKTHAKYIPVVYIQGEDQAGTALVYYACIKKGIGWQFRKAYFEAVISGMPAYTPETLVAVLKQITSNPSEILKYATTPEIQEKLVLDRKLIEKFHVTVTPTWVINMQYTLDGETALLPFLKE